MRRPTITLTTDFGTSDHFVGAMKGVILSLCPTAQVVDITHEVTPFEIAQGAFLLAQAAAYFPKNTIHVAIVDPGVGGARRPLLVESEGRFFIGPDNGIFGLVYEGSPHPKVREITNTRLFLPQVSRTFHGRDVFAPAAAHLAAGAKPASFGRKIDDYLKPAPTRPLQTGRRFWTGTVLHIDRFGNLVSTFKASDFPQLRERPFELQAGMAKISTLAETYAAMPPREPHLIEGSAGYYEISVNQGNAAKALGVGLGAPLELVLY
ncbi:MAG: SAM-dependent chlorinase/fluorinase [Bryobacteraceae bacterium]|nr:SAM-dependent chlorinase/fluorinase [Bryobacteraceae bacterium]